MMFKSYADKAESVFREHGYQVERGRRHLKVKVCSGRFSRERMMEIFRIADECSVKACLAGSIDVDPNGDVSLDGCALIHKKEDQRKAIG